MNNIDLLTLAKKYSSRLAPMSAVIELTNACNFDCIHCYIKREPRQYLPKDKTFEILEKLKNMGCLKIAYTGGEPLMHPQFEDILDYTIKLKFQYTILTNGYFIDDKLINKFANSGFLKSVHLSFYGVSANIHNSITRRCGSFENLMILIKKLKEYNIKFILKTAIIKQNYCEWENIMQFSDNNGYLQVSEFTLMPREDGDTDNLKYALTEKELKEINIILRDKYKKKLALKSEYTDKEKFLESYVCVAGKNKLAIGYNGDVYPCIAWRMKVGNIFNDKFENIWYNNKKLNEIRNLKNKDINECRDCDIFTYCKYRCIGVSYAYYQDIYRAPSVRCNIAKISREVLNEKTI